MANLTAKEILLTEGTITASFKSINEYEFEVIDLIGSGNPKIRQLEENLRSV